MMSLTRLRPALPWLCLTVMLCVAAFAEPLLARRTLTRTILIGRDDLGLTQGWHYDEWSDSLPGHHGPFTAIYRWSRANSELLFPHAPVGQGSILALDLLGGRPDGRSVAPVTVRAANQPPLSFAVESLPRRYLFYLGPAAATASGLKLQLDSATYRPAGDSRDVGVIGLWARLRPAGPVGIPMPATGLPLLALSVLALLLVNGLRPARAAWGTAMALVLVLACGFAAPLATLQSADTATELCAIAAGCVIMVRLWLGFVAPRLPRRPWLWAAVGLSALTLVGFTPIMGSDGVEYYAYVRSLAFDGDIEFSNEFDPSVPFSTIPTWLVHNETPTGYSRNLASVGPAVVWAPFVAIAHGMALLGNALGVPWSTDGYSRPYVLLVNLASLLALPITVWLGYLTARRLVDARSALLASLALAFGSGIMYFSLLRGDFPHALGAASVAAFLYWWARVRPNPTLRQWAVLGALAGLASMIYWIDAIICLLPALDLGLAALLALRHRDFRAIGRLFTGGVVFAVAALIAFAPQMVAWQILFGAPITVPHGAKFAEAVTFKLPEMIFSPVHGQLLWMPITCVAFLGFGWYMARARWEGFAVLAAFALYFCYNATLESWHGGGLFGLRRVVNMLPLLTPALACLLAWLARRGRWWPLTLCAICVAWSSAVLLRYQSRLIPGHPGDLSALSIREFVLAPTNLPWYQAGNLLPNQFFPTLLWQATHGFPGNPWASLFLSLAVTLALIWGMIALLSRLHSRAVCPPLPASHGRGGSEGQSPSEREEKSFFLGAAGSQTPARREGINL